MVRLARSLSFSQSLSVSKYREAGKVDGCPGSEAATDANSLSNGLAAEELPSNFGRFGSLSTDEVCLMGVVSCDGGDDEDEDDDSEELPE